MNADQASQRYANKKLRGAKNSYVINKIIGRGQFGEVYGGSIAETGERVAIKVQPCRVIEKNARLKRLFENEVSNLREIQNQNVVRLYELILIENRYGGDYLMVMEFCADGNLMEYIESKPNKALKENEAVEFIKQILNAINALHERNIVHRDIKLQNILLSNSQVKLCDLGFSKNVGEDGIAQTALGTPITMAPELLAGDTDYNAFQSDVYSLGVIFFYMLYGDYPFTAKSILRLGTNIRSKNYATNPDSRAINPTLKKLVLRMLDPNPHTRITFEQIYAHEIFRKEQGIVPARKTTMLEIQSNNIDRNRNAAINQYQVPPNVHQKLRDDDDTLEILRQRRELDERKEKLEQQQQQQQQQGQAGAINNTNNNAASEEQEERKEPQNAQQQQQQQEEHEARSPQPPPQNTRLLQFERSTVENVDEEEHTTIKINLQRFLHQEQAVRRALSKYQNEINIIDEFAETILLENKLPRYQSFALVGILMLYRRLFHELRKLATSIEERRNTFNCEFPDRLFQSSVMANILTEIKQRLAAEPNSRATLEMDIQDNFKEPQLSQVSKLLNDEWSPLMDRTYAAEVARYAQSIKGEIEKRANKPEKRDEAIAFVNFLRKIADCVRFDAVFRSKEFTDFAAREAKWDKLTLEERIAKVEKKVDKMSEFVKQLTK